MTAPARPHAARRWTRADLAGAAVIGVVPACQSEGSSADPRPAALTVLWRAPAAAGILRMVENRDGPGVELRKRDAGDGATPVRLSLALLLVVLGGPAQAAGCRPSPDGCAPVGRELAPGREAPVAADHGARGLEPRVAVPLLADAERRAARSQGLPKPAATEAWRSLKSSPQDFVGRTVTLDPAYCGTGGQEGKQPGLYQCAVGPGSVYVESRAAVLSRAARTRMKGCGGLDVWERSAFCRSTVTFVVGRYRSAPDIDAEARPLLFTADTLAVD